MDFVKRTVGLVTALGVLSIIGCENPIADITFESSDESNVHIYGSDTDTTEIAEDTLSSVMFNLFDAFHLYCSESVYLIRYIH